MSFAYTRTEIVNRKSLTRSALPRRPENTTCRTFPGSIVVESCVTIVKLLLCRHPCNSAHTAALVDVSIPALLVASVLRARAPPAPADCVNAMHCKLPGRDATIRLASESHHRKDDFQSRSKNEYYNHSQQLLHSTRPNLEQNFRLSPARDCFDKEPRTKSQSTDSHRAPPGRFISFKTYLLREASFLQLCIPQ